MIRKQALHLCVWLYCFFLGIIQFPMLFFKPTCIAVQFASPILQYTLFLVDDCFSIHPGDSCLFPASLAIQREEHQRRIPVDLRARVCSAGRTFYPLGMSFFFLHYGTFFRIQAALTQFHASSQVTMSGTEKVFSSPVVMMISSPDCASTGICKNSHLFQISAKLSSFLRNLFTVASLSFVM